MFRNALKKIEAEETRHILKTLNGVLQAAPFDAGKAAVLSCPLPFYPGYSYLEITDHDASPPTVRHLIYKGDDFAVLNWGAKVLEDLNRRVPIRLTGETVCDYLRFYLSHVRGSQGPFQMVEGVDDIDWRDDPPPSARKAIGKMISPLRIQEKTAEGTYILKGAVIHKDSLFEILFVIEPDGKLSTRDEKLLVEDMPVIDGIFGL